MFDSPVLEYWDQRLTNWALWEVGLASVGVSAYDGEWGECAPRPPPPLVGEALDTDRLVRRLEADLYAAVRAHYIWTGYEYDKAAALKIAHKTLIDRVRIARFKLDDLYHADLGRSRNILAKMLLAA